MNISKRIPSRECIGSQRVLTFCGCHLRQPSPPDTARGSGRSIGLGHFRRPGLSPAPSRATSFPLRRVCSRGPTRVLSLDVWSCPGTGRTGQSALALQWISGGRVGAARRCLVRAEHELRRRDLDRQISYAPLRMKYQLLVNP